MVTPSTDTITQHLVLSSEPRLEGFLHNLNYVTYPSYIRHSAPSLVTPKKDHTENISH